MANHQDSKCHMQRQIQRCSVCLDDIRKPKCLPCLHVMCLACLQKMLNQRTCDRECMMALPITFPCPVCRRECIINGTSADLFPSPIICKKCHCYLEQVVEMCCGHRNEDICFDCLVRDNVGRSFKCPQCGKRSWKTSMQRMFLCHICYKFSATNCKLCVSKIMKYGTPHVDTSRYSSNDADRTVFHLQVLVLLAIVTAIVAILSTTRFLLEELNLSDSRPEEITCCSISVWHVDGWGNVDTTWCSGDDWKLTSAECVIWPPKI